MTTLGIAIIGQAPRSDIAATYARMLGPGTRIVMRGCLDDLDRRNIDEIRPESDADALYTRLPDGAEVTIAKRVVTARAAITLQRLRDDGADALVFNCTGAFPPIPGDAGVVFPSRVLAGLAQGLVPAGRIALLVPLAEQCGPLVAKWQRSGVEVVAHHLTPTAAPATIAEAANRLRAERPDLVCLDCMGYTEPTRRIVREITGAPTLLAITTMAAVLREMLP
ncbi:MAG: AroM family protein [Pseudomonadota bacterium]